MTSSRSKVDQDGVFESITGVSAQPERWSKWNVGRVRVFGIYIHFKYFVLLMLELMIVSTAIFYSYAQGTLDQPQAAGWLVAKSLLGAAPFSLCFAGLGLYSSRQTLSRTGTIMRYLVASSIAFPLLYGFHRLVLADLTAIDMAAPLAVGIVLLACLRSSFSSLLDNNLLKRRVLVVGQGHKAEFVQRIANDPDQRGFSLLNLKPDLTMPGALVEAVKRYRINEVVVALDDRRTFLPTRELLDCRLSGVSVVDVLDFLEREMGVIPFEHLQPSWLIFTDGFTGTAISAMAKRAFDITASLGLIVITLPITLITCLAIKMDRQSPGPIVYRQKRVGLDGRPFNVFKFRSMRTDAEKNGKAQWATQNDTRVTRIGALLRNYRIDELPQLFNVLFGTMSLVGPRPERPVFVEMLQERNSLYNERHRVKPGVTGWAQLRFPYTDNEEDSILKLQYDMYYLKNQGFFFDFYILLQTIEVVLFGKGSR